VAQPSNPKTKSWEHRFAPNVFLVAATPRLVSGIPTRRFPLSNHIHCGSNTWFFSIIASITIVEMGATRNDPTVVVVSADTTRRKRNFRPIYLGVAISEHCSSKRYQVMAWSFLPASKSQLLHWWHFQKIHSSWSFRLALTQNNSIFPSIGSGDSG